MTSKPTATDSPVDATGSPAIGSPTSLETLLGLRSSTSLAGKLQPATDAMAQEKALLELEEYLRVGTQLIFEATLDSQSLQSSARETTES